MSDAGYQIVQRQIKHQLLHIEIKNPSVVDNDWIYHTDFVKLGNLMKDKADFFSLKPDCLNKDLPSLEDV